MLDDTPERIDFLIDLSQTYYSGEKSMKHALSALSLSKEIGSVNQLGNAYVQVAWSHSSNYDMNLASVYIDSALQILESIKPGSELVRAYNVKALLFMDYGQFDLAEGIFQKALTLSVEAKDIEAQARVLNRWGVMYIRQKKGLEASKKHKKTLGLVRLLKNDILISRSIHNLGVSAFLMKEYKIAIDYLIESYNLRSRIKYYNGLAETMAKIAEVIFTVESANISPEYYYDKLNLIGYDSTFDMLESILLLPGSQTTPVLSALL